MANRRVWNDGRRETLTKAISANFVAMASSPGGRAGDQAVRKPGLMDAINELTGGNWAPGIDDGRGRAADGGYTGFVAMPRDPGNDNAFGPMDPLTPEAIDRLDGDGRTEPRAFEYQVGWNLPGAGQRETPWGVLRAAASGIGIIRRCIEIRKKDVRTLKWSFAPTEDAINEAYEANRGAGRLDAEQRLREELMPEIRRMRERWQKPWRANDKDFGDWANAVMEDALVLDGVAIHPRRTLGGDIYDLEYIDATTIKLLLNAQGIKPSPPFPAYQQILYGFPRGEWRATTSMELDERGQEIQVLRDGFSTDQLYYHVSNSRSFTPYGLSPVEMALFDSRLYLQRMKWMLAEYDDGSTPMTWIETAPSEDGKTMTLTQQRLWEKAFNAKNSGNTRERHRAKVMPHGWKATQMTSADERYKPEYDLYLIKLLASYFGVTATRLGFGESNGLGGSGFHEGQMDVSGQLGLKPDTEVLTDIVNSLSRDVLGMDPRIAFSFVDPAAANDAEQAAVTDGQVKGGQISINEARQGLGQSLLPFKEANMPFILGGPNGIIFLEGAKASIEAAEAQKQLAAETQALGTAGKLGLEEKKLEDGQAAREEGREFAREEREAAAEAEVTKSAEIDAFRRWRRKQGDTPRRPFLFKTVGPDDGWADLDGLGPDTVAYEGWEWLADEDLEKAAKKSPFDWIGWNAANPLHPKGPNGRWVKRGSDLHTALVEESERHAKATGRVSDASTTVESMSEPAYVSAAKVQPGMIISRPNSYDPTPRRVTSVAKDGVTWDIRTEGGGPTTVRAGGATKFMLHPESSPKGEAPGSIVTQRPKVKTLPEVTVAKERMRIIEQAQKRARVLGDLEESLDAEMGTAALRRSMRASVKREGLDDDESIAGLAGVVETSVDTGDIRRHMNMTASRLGLARVEADDRYDPASHRTTGEGLSKGDAVQLVRPGYAIKHGDENIVVDRPVVESRIVEHETPQPDQRTAQMEAHIQAAEDDTLAWIDSKGGKVRTDQINIRRLERLRDKGLITMRDAKQGSLKGEPHERRYSEFRRVVELTDAGRAHLAGEPKTPAIPTAPDANSFESARRGEWEKWALGIGGTRERPGPVRPIEAHAIPKEETLTGADKHGIFLPDGITGYVDRSSPKKPILRDIESDQVLFTGSSVPDLWRKVSAHYGATVKHHHQGTDKVTRYGEMGDPFEAPAGREYAPVRTAHTPQMSESLEVSGPIGIDANSFVTSKVNAHSLRRGDMVVVTGRAGSVVAHERVGNHIIVILDDGRELKLGLNEPLPRVHGGNLHKAVDPGEPAGGGADPKAQEPVAAPPPDDRWPGWLLDMIIATLIAQALVDALTAPGMAITALVRRFFDWLGGFQAGDPTPDVHGWVRQGDTLSRIVRAIEGPIRDAHVQGALVGQRSAQAVLDAIGELGDARNALDLTIDWSGWSPGHPEAARALLDAPGLANLLYQSGVTIRGIALGRLDEIARILSEGLARGDAPDKIARALAERLGSSSWAKMTAVTETNRAMSYAAVQEYRAAGLHYKGWMTAFDQRVCPICKENESNPDGSPRIVPIDELFPSGDPWPPGHPRCRCAPIPILQHQLDALGLGGNIAKALNVAQWNVQNPLHPKDSDGKWAETPGSAIRPALAGAEKISDLRKAFEQEAKRITGNRIVNNLQGNMETAREHSEGILRCLERFPDVRLHGVSVRTDAAGVYASAGGRWIRFNHAWTASKKARAEYLASLASGVAGWDEPRRIYSEWVPTDFHVRNSHSPISVAIHEFGHILDIDTLNERIKDDMDALIERRRVELSRKIMANRADLGLETWDLSASEVIEREVSGYAKTNRRELAAEAFTDVMLNGDKASVLSRGIFDLLVAEYERWNT